MRIKNRTKVNAQHVTVEKGCRALQYRNGASGTVSVESEFFEFSVQRRSSNAEKLGGFCRVLSTGAVCVFYGLSLHLIKRND